MKLSMKLGLLVGMLSIGLVNCAAKKIPKAPPDPKFTSIQKISVLPILDARPGSKAKVNLRSLQSSVVNTLKRKHYPVGAEEATSSGGQIDVDDLESADPGVVKKLGPDADRWVMIVMLNDVHSKRTFWSTGNAEMSGYLFDKADGSLVWKGKGTGTAGQGGLLGMTMKGMMNSAALESAVAALLSTMPNLPKSR